VQDRCHPRTSFADGVRIVRALAKIHEESTRALANCVGLISG
jgi:hypothetical protein